MERALAHVEVIKDIQPIPNADAIDVATVLGWKVVVKKNEFKVGDKVIYIEIDSLVPPIPGFEFLRERKYKVKTIKLRGQYSQGLIVALSLLGRDAEVGEDVTKELGITYYVPEDNARKAGVDPNAKYRSMVDRHKNLFKKKIFKRLMRYAWGRKVLFFFFGKKKDNPKGFPTHFPYVHKSDEERIENCPWHLENRDARWVKTTKIDGTSCLYVLERKRRGFEYYVCSRNVRQADRAQQCYHDDNVYWEIEDKYHIRDALESLLNLHPSWTYVAVQGEGAGCTSSGSKIQGDPHQFGELRFFAYNFIDSERGRWGSIDGKILLAQYNVEWIPIVDEACELPDNMEDMKLSADGDCEAPGAHGAREGYVYRCVSDPNISFKNVSRKYLLKHEQ